MKASARSAASYEDSLAKVDRRAAKTEPQTRPGNPRARWGAHSLLARAQITASSEGGDGSRSGLHGGESRSEGEGTGWEPPHTHVAVACVEALAVEDRGGAQASADEIHGARSGEAGNSDRVLWSVKGEGGVLSGRNPSSSAQGEGDDDVQRARSAQERGRGRGNGGRRARGQGRETSNRPNAESERSREGVGAGPKTELARSVEKQLRDLQSAQQK